MKILFIHGALGSPTCWNYLKSRLPCEPIFLRYDMTEDIGDIIERGVELCATNEADAIIGHSMGGIIAVHIGRICKVKKVLTIATPWGGIGHLPMDSKQPLFKDVFKMSPWIILLSILNSLRKEVDVERLVTNAGHNSFLPELNDSVVTISSQKTNILIPTIELDVNHNEVLQDDRTLGWIIDRLAGL